MEKINKENVERAELHKKIWEIADDLRGAVSGANFQQYVLGTLFYRFISENMCEYFDKVERENDPEFSYAELSDEEALQDFLPGTVKEKGFFIKPSQLFVNVVKNAKNNENLNIDLANIFKGIEASAIGSESEDDIKGLFDDIDTTSKVLGESVTEKNKKLVANAGKSGGEFFTPQSVSKLLARLAMVGKEEINAVYDPTCGSGSLLLQMKKYYDNKKLKNGFYGQEINIHTYNLSRMNMFLHNINYDKFNIKRGDTLLNPMHLNEKPFDIVVANPPYSVKWVGEADPTLINDERFSPAGKLAPKTKADFAFVLHALNHLSTKGRAAIVCFPGIFYRGGAEKTIRKYLVDNNYIESIIALPDNLFFGTGIATYILTMAKNKVDNKVLFIDASSEFKKVGNKNILSEENINNIASLFENREDAEYKSKYVSIEEIAEADYNLSVSSYVEKEDTREKIDIVQLNKKLEETVKNIDRLREEINSIVKELS